MMKRVGAVISNATPDGRTVLASMPLTIALQKWLSNIVPVATRITILARHCSGMATPFDCPLSMPNHAGPGLLAPADKRNWARLLRANEATRATAHSLQFTLN